MSAVAVNYTAPKTVARFLRSNVFVRVIQGPIGSGKSSGCMMEFLRRAKEQAPGPDGIRRTRFAAIRNTYGQLSDTTRKTFEQWIPDALGEWNETEFSFTMEFGDVHCEVLFRALDKPKDVRKVLSLDLTGAYINEVREVPKEILDGLTGRVGRYPSMADGGPTWSGIWADTNPWAVGHWLHELFVANEAPQDFECFVQPSGLGPEAENISGLPKGYYARLCLGKDKEWIDEYVHGKNPKRDKGSVYGELLATLEEIGFMREFVHEADNVFVVHDLGISDATAQWYVRPNAAGAVDFLDHYEDTGKPLSHFFEAIAKREKDLGFKIRGFVLPHDARARTLVTGESVQDKFMQRYPGRVFICPQLSLEDGLQATRALLEKPTRFHPRCAKGLKALRGYRYAFDDDKKVYSKKPVHDWASHTADGCRYTAVFHQLADVMTAKTPEPPKKPAAVPMHESFTLNEMFQARERELSGD